MARRTRRIPRKQKDGNRLLQQMGSYAFFIGVLVAVFTGIAVAGTLVSDDILAGTAFLIAFLGIVVGGLSAFGLGTINKDNSIEFIVASIALVVTGAGASSFAKIPYFGAYLANMAIYVALFAAPVATVLALKAIWDIGSGK